MPWPLGTKPVMAQYWANTHSITGPVQGQLWCHYSPSAGKLALDQCRQTELAQFWLAQRLGTSPVHVALTHPVPNQNWPSTVPTQNAISTRYETSNGPVLGQYTFHYWPSTGPIMMPLLAQCRQTELAQFWLAQRFGTGPVHVALTVPNQYWPSTGPIHISLLAQYRANWNWPLLKQYRTSTGPVKKHYHTSTGPVPKQYQTSKGQNILELDHNKKSCINWKLTHGFRKHILWRFIDERYSAK